MKNGSAQHASPAVAGSKIVVKLKTAMLNGTPKCRNGLSKMWKLISLCIANSRVSPATAGSKTGKIIEK